MFNRATMTPELIADMLVGGDAIRRAVQRQFKAAVTVPAATVPVERSSKARRDQRMGFQVKAESLDEDTHTFTGLASTWDRDLGGDVIVQGAFKKTLKEWKQSGRIMPLIDQHASWGSIRAVVGKMLEAAETDEGLECKFQVIDGPDGDEIWRRIAGGYVDGLSIGYRPVKIEMPTEEESAEGIYRFLTEVRLEEISIVIWPMNTGARVLSAKHLLEAARTRSLTEDEKQELREWQEEIGAVLTASGAPAAEPAAPAAEPTPTSTVLVKDLAPDDPLRVELEHRARTLRLRTLTGRR